MGYSPILGRFLQRDPISSAGAEILASGPEITEVDNSRDPVTLDAMGSAAVRIWATLGRRYAMQVMLWQYADGMNLYQYVEGNPAIGLDPSGMANTVPGQHGGVCYLPCPPNHDRLTCMSNCIEQNDPLNLLARGLLAGIGGPIPKALVSALGGRAVGFGVNPSPFTTPPSIISNALRLPMRNPLRTVGAIGFWLQILYGLYMAGVEDRCLGACAGDPCAY